MNHAIGAVANKNARIIWTLLDKNDNTALQPDAGRFEVPAKKEMNCMRRL